MTNDRVCAALVSSSVLLSYFSVHSEHKVLMHRIPVLGSRFLIALARPGAAYGG